MNEDSQTIGLSVTTFCRRAGFSKGLFYKLLKGENPPPIIKIGKRTIIPAEQGVAWLEQQINGGNHAE